MNSGNALGRMGSALRTMPQSPHPPPSASRMDAGLRNSGLRTEDSVLNCTCGTLCSQFPVLRLPLGVRHNTLSEDRGAQ